MNYAQVLRLRKALTIYGIVIGALFVLMFLISHTPGGATFDDNGSPHTMAEITSVPLSLLFFIAAWCAIIFATIVSTSLNKEYDGVEMVWTKPIERGRLALEYVLLDFAAIVVAFVSAAVLCVLCVASLGLLTRIAVDDRTIPTLVIGLGAAFMWYGLLEGITAPMRGRGGTIMGVSWAAALVLTALATATQAGGGSAIHTILIGLNIFNPLAYFSSYSLSGYGAHDSPVLPQVLAGTEMRMTMTWAIGMIGCAVAITGWKRLEA